MNNPRNNAQRIVEQALLENGFAGYSVTAEQQLQGVIVKISCNKHPRIAIGSAKVLASIIERTNADGLDLEQEFEKRRLYA